MKLPEIDALIVESTDAVRVALTLGHDLAAFEGHYPDLPVLPGVVQVDWALGYARAHLGVGQDAAPTFKVKFRRVIAPGSQVALSLRRDTARARLAFTYWLGDEVASVGEIALVP